MVGGGGVRLTSTREGHKNNFKCSEGKFIIHTLIYFQSMIMLLSIHMKAEHCQPISGGGGGVATSFLTVTGEVCLSFEMSRNQK